MARRWMYMPNIIRFSVEMKTAYLSGHKNTISLSAGGLIRYRPQEILRRVKHASCDAE